MIPKRKAIDLSEPSRLTSSHDLHPEREAWTSTGADPYLVFNLSDQRFIGSWMLDLVIEGLPEGSRPRIYVHQRRGFSDSAAQDMRREDTSRYQLALTLPRRSQMIRLDPAESECRFQIKSFTAKPISIGNFLARVSRNGEDRISASVRRIGNVGHALAEIGKRRVAFETGDMPRKTTPGSSYAHWIAKFETPFTSRGAVETRCRALRNAPLISVLMPVYNTPEHILDAAIGSVVEQAYQNWELCIADDASAKPWIRPKLERWQQADSRIRVAHRDRNGHISEATNTAFSIARGEWIALLDHDDTLAPNALAEVAFAIEAHPQTEIIYSDEDKIDERGRRCSPYFKPDWSYDLFTGQNYLNHLTVHRAENIRKVGGWRRGFEGSQDYDLSLRIVETIDPSRIHHIPKVLYHWRAARGSAARSGSAKTYAHDSGLRALSEHVERLGLRATIVPAAGGQYYRLRRSLPDEQKLISLIIPACDKVEALRTCVESILNKTDYSTYELLIVYNNSVEPGTHAYLSSLEDRANVRVLRYADPLNVSAINNFAARSARGELIGLINNEVEVINRDWLAEMASQAVRPEIGCVGVKLYYPNDTVQHAGIILGRGGIAGYSHKYFSRAAKGYYGRLVLVQNLMAVSAACLLVRKELYVAAGGFDEHNLKVAFNDIDFCLRVRQLGYSNLWTPFAELYRHESVSLGSDTPGAMERLQGEIQYMQERWGDELRADPYYSANLTRSREDFSLAN